LLRCAGYPAASDREGVVSRSLAERKVSVTLRIAELRAALRAAEKADAEIDIAIENEQRNQQRALPEVARG